MDWPLAATAERETDNDSATVEGMHPNHTLVWGSHSGCQIVSYREVGISDEQDQHID